MNPPATPPSSARILKGRWLLHRAGEIVAAEAARQGRPLPWSIRSEDPPLSPHSNAFAEATEAVRLASQHVGHRLTANFHQHSPQRLQPLPPRRPQPLAACDQDWRVDDVRPDYVVTGDFGRFDPGMAGIEPAILGRIWRAKEITARLAAAGQLGDLPRLDDCLIRPAWGASRYVSELGRETGPEVGAIAFVIVEHHPTCPVSPHGTGCRCGFMVTITIGEREWSVSEDGTLALLPALPIHFKSVRRYRPGLSDWGRGLPEFHDIVRRRGPVVWDRRGVAFVPDSFQVVFLGDHASELIPFPLPTASADE